MDKLGDKIDSLPINKEHIPKPNELEFAYRLFQPQNKELITQTVSVFLPAVGATILFALLSLPAVSTLIISMAKGNSLYGRMILVAIFFIVFFIIDKYWLASK